MDEGGKKVFINCLEVGRVILKCSEFSVIASDIKKKNTRIVMFGTGVIGQMIAPHIFVEYGLLPYVDCYIDNNSDLWGCKVEVCGYEIEVRSPEYLKNCNSDTVIMLNISRFSNVLDQLMTMRCTVNMECYIFPMLCVHNYCLEASKGEAKRSSTPLIPKKIHYMWLGRKPDRKSVV